MYEKLVRVFELVYLKKKLELYEKYEDRLQSAFYEARRIRHIIKELGP